VHASHTAAANSFSDGHVRAESARLQAADGGLNIERPMRLCGSTLRDRQRALLRSGAETVRRRHSSNLGYNADGLIAAQAELFRSEEDPDSSSFSV
jgi:hypothetical protein